MQDATTEVFEVYTELRRRVSVHDMKIRARAKRRELLEEVPFFKN